MHLNIGRLAVILTLGALAACGRVVGDEVGGGNDAAPVDGRPGGAIDAPVNPVDTVRELRLSSPRNGDAVSLRNVVVVGRAVGRMSGVVYVQDEGGGMGTGIRLLCLFDAGCTVTPAQIMGLAIGQRLDVTGVYDQTPAPVEPQLIRFTMTNRGSATPVATTVAAAVVAHDQAGAIGPWVLTYVRVAGPLTVTSVSPAALRTTCELADAGSEPAYRGVFVRTATPPPVDLAVQTVDLDYCVSQCGVTCDMEIMVDDPIDSVQGVVIIGDRGGSSAEVLIRPAADADLPH